jgi:hypothetical protein
MPEEKSYLKDIEKLIGKKIPVAHDHPAVSSDRRHTSDEAPRTHELKRAGQASHARSHTTAAAKPELKLVGRKEERREHPAKPKAVTQSGAPAAPRNKKKAKTRWRRRGPAR